MKLMTKISNWFVAKSIAKAIKKETGRKTKVKVHKMEISKNDKKTTIHTDVVIVCNNNDLDKFK